MFAFHGHHHHPRFTKGWHSRACRLAGWQTTPSGGGWLGSHRVVCRSPPGRGQTIFMGSSTAEASRASDIVFHGCSSCLPACLQGYTRSRISSPVNCRGPWRRSKQRLRGRVTRVNPHKTIKFQYFPNPPRLQLSCPVTGPIRSFVGHCTGPGSVDTHWNNNNNLRISRTDSM